MPARPATSQEPASARDTAAILVAAGESTRMRGPGSPSQPRKPWLELGGRPLVAHALAAFAAAPSVAELVLVGHGDDLERLRELAVDEGLGLPVAVVSGGATRAGSVRAGLAGITGSATLVAIHDAARPLITPGLIERVLERARATGAALPVLPIVDTLKRVRDDDVIDTVSRDELVRAQTPQCFERGRFAAFATTYADDLVTDDSSLWERHAGPVALVTGEESNFKLTRPGDLELARFFLERQGGEPA